MSGDRPCGYEPTGVDVPDLPSGWSCPRPSDGDADSCLFHRSPEETDDATVASRLEAILAGDSGDTPDHARRLVGARFGTVSLANVRVEFDDNQPVDLRGATFEGRVDLTNTEWHAPLLLDGAAFGGDLVLDGASFSDAVGVSGARFHGRVSCLDAGFEGSVDFTETTFGPLTTFHGARFEGDPRFTDARFQGFLKFSRATVEGSAQFGRTHYGKRARFKDVTFRSLANFDDAVFSDVATFVGTSFERGLQCDGIRFGGPTRFEDVVVDRDASFLGAELRDDVTFDDADFGRDVTLSGTIHGSLSFEGIRVRRRLVIRDVDAAGDVRISVRRSEVPGGRLGLPASGTAVYDLADATIGDVELGEVADGGSPFESYRFERTVFDGFDFTEYNDALVTNDWGIHGTSRTDRPWWQALALPAVFDPSLRTSGTETPAERASEYAALEGTYLRAKNGANQVGDSKAAAEFFIRELTCRRRKHFWHARDLGRPPSVVHAGSRWAANLALGLSAGYGERPSYVLGTALTLVVVFAGLFRAIAPSLYADALPYASLSLGAFVTLVFGNPGPIENYPLVSLLAHFEGLLGAFVIALFVFTLTRAIDR